MAGTSLLGVGIYDKDIVLLSPRVDATTNDIVVARVNGAIYIRRYAQTMRHIFLLSTEPEHPTIRIQPTDNFRIVGVLLCSIHPIHTEARTRLRTCQLQLSAINEVLGLHEPSIFCSRVHGHSMHDANIFEGDVLVIERGRMAKERDIVVASWHGGYLVKRLVQDPEGKTSFLFSDNPLIPPVIVTSESELEIWGTVLYSLHPLHPIVKQRLNAHHRHAQ